MQLEKTTILLEKINNLHNSLLKDANNISRIERDLLKDYVRALYDAMLDAPVSTVLNEIEVTPQRSKPEPPGDQPKSSNVVEPSPIAAEPEKEAYKPPRIIELSNDLKEDLASTPPPPKAEEVHHDAPAPQMDDELSELFMDDPANIDLSDRLANSPIKDLTKAISINDKIFTVNELFGGNMVDFEQTLKTLNGCEGFSNATSLILVDKAKEYGWTEKNRLKKAKKFVKLVRRRYL